MGIPEEVKEVLEKVELVWVGTSSDDVPNVNIVAFFKVMDGEILLVDNFFNKTRKNLEDNPKVAITVNDPESGAAYQLKGNAEIHTEGEIFENARKWVRSVEEDMPAKAAVVVDVEKIFDSSSGAQAGEEI